MNKKLLYGALAGIFSVGMLTACGDIMEEDEGVPMDGGEDEGDMEEDPGAEDEGGIEEDPGAEDEDDGMDDF
ncbi:DNA primase [Salicibibacter halophilus]|uniref:DNA primase n=1 Tax=Salicibibacter halophilus TaxID=2502791 RepID=A0A514LJA6_9BACI|nr:DNA primase [Salicibibacter halophilus]QDI91381.1 DNA primase [Salicibibacter halophilus]